MAQDRKLFLKWIYITDSAEPPVLLACRSRGCVAYLSTNPLYPTPHPVFRVHQPRRARKSRMGEQNHASWKRMHSGKGLRSYTGFWGLSIISHFRFKFWIAFSQDYCWTPWLSSILEFELVIKKKQPTYKEVVWKMIMFCVHLWLMVYDETVNSLWWLYLLFRVIQTLAKFLTHPENSCCCEEE